MTIRRYGGVFGRRPRFYSAEIETNLLVSGNLTVNGTTTIINTEIVTIDDPVFTVGGDTPPVLDDGKDRGIEFRWHNGTDPKIGFFGFDRSTGTFTFIPDATNNSEVFSGATGTITANISGNVTGDLTGNASTATALQTGRTISITGDLAYTSGAFDGTGNVTGTGTLSNTGVVAATYGSTSLIPQIVVDSKGRITSASDQTPSGTWNISITGNAATATSTLSSTAATNLAGGSAGAIPYQSAIATTAFLSPGTTGQVLQTNGAAAPSWVNGTISGVALGSSLFTLTRGSYLTGSNYDGSAGTTWAVDATSTNTGSKVVARDSAGDFSANIITASLSGNATTATTATKLSVADTQAVTTTPETTSSPQVVFDFKSNSAESLTDGGSYFGEMTFRPAGNTTDWTNGPAHQLGFTSNGNIWHRSGSNTTWGTWRQVYESDDATASNTVDKLVLRNGSGDFAAGTITATLSGNASTATALQTSRTLWGQSFNGTANVTGSLTSVGDITGTAGIAITATSATLALAATGANVITAATNGATRVTINDSGLGIGVVPTDALHVEGNVYLGTTSRTIYQGGTSDLSLQVNSGAIKFKRNAGTDTSVHIDTTGKVGIGTAPAKELHVYGNAATAVTARVENAATSNSYAAVDVHAGTVQAQLYSDAAGNALGTAGAMLQTVTSHDLYFGTGSTVRFLLDAAGNAVLGNGAVLTTATNGFLYLVTCPGKPTGVPSSKTGRVPVIIDSTADTLYMYNGGAWKEISGSGGGGLARTFAMMGA